MSCSLTTNYDFSAFNGNSTNGGQGGLSPVNQPDPNYVSYDFSAFNGNATNGGQGGLSPVNQPDPNYVSYDFSAFNGNATNGSQGGLAASSQGGGMSFLGGSTAPVSGGSPASAGAAAGGAAPVAASSPAMGAAAAPAGAGMDAASLISQSPFGSLLSLPGVTADNLFSNVNPANYGGSNPFAVLGSSVTSGAYGGNPFAAIDPFVSQAVASGTSAITAAPSQP